MIRELHIEHSREIKVIREPDLGTTKIEISDWYSTALAIVIPDGTILDELAHRLLMASIDTQLQI